MMNTAAIGVAKYPISSRLKMTPILPMDSSLAYVIDMKIANDTRSCHSERSACPERSEGTIS